MATDFLLLTDALLVVVLVGPISTMVAGPLLFVGALPVVVTLSTTMATGPLLLVDTVLVAALVGPPHCPNRGHGGRSPRPRGRATCQPAFLT